MAMFWIQRSLQAEPKHVPGYLESKWEAQQNSFTKEHNNYQKESHISKLHL